MWLSYHLDTKPLVQVSVGLGSSHPAIEPVHVLAQTGVVKADDFAGQVLELASLPEFCEPGFPLFEEALTHPEGDQL
jgi:hypothetical protein